MFPYEKWRVYQLALEMREIADELSRTAPPGMGSDTEELRGCATSVLANIGEGCMRRHKRVKIFHYDTARGSTGEYNAVLKGMWRRHPNRRLIERGQSVANQESAGLSRLIKRVELWPDKRNKGKK